MHERRFVNQVFARVGCQPVPKVESESILHLMFQVQFTELCTIIPSHFARMFSVVLHHDAGWAEFDRDPVTDPATGLPYNLVDTPVEYITVTSRLSPDFNQRQHPFCGLMIRSLTPCRCPWGFRGSATSSQFLKAAR